MDHNNLDDIRDLSVLKELCHFSAADNKLRSMGVSPVKFCRAPFCHAAMRQMTVRERFQRSFPSLHGLAQGQNYSTNQRGCSLETSPTDGLKTSTSFSLFPWKADFSLPPSPSSGPPRVALSGRFIQVRRRSGGGGGLISAL